MTKETENLLSFACLRDIFWSRRGILAGMTMAGLLIGIMIGVIVGGNYSVSLTMIPAESDADRASSFQLSSILSNSADLPVSKFKQFQQELYSYQTAASMNRHYDTICEIYRNRCDIITHTWKPEPEWRKLLSATISTILGMPPAPKTPQVGDLVKYIKAHVTLKTERTSSLITISMAGHNPERAKLFLSRLVSTANQAVRERDRSDLRQYVDYLSNRLEHLDSVAQRPALDSLLLTEERRLMLTNVDVAYAATTLDGPNAIRSNSAWIIGVGLVIGLLFGCIVAILIQFIRGDVKIIANRPPSKLRARQGLLRDV